MTYNDCPIRATVISDCQNFKTSFDAQEWAKQATYNNFQALILEDFSAGYASDEVAEVMSQFDKNVKKFFDDKECLPVQPLTKDPNGFTCTVNEDDISNWLKANRPDWKFEKTSQEELWPN